MMKIYFISILTIIAFCAAAQNMPGTPDSSFGTNASKVITTPDSLGNLQLRKLVILPNNKILTLLGYSGGALVRNKPAGGADSSFGVNGILAVPGITLYSLAVQDNGRILTAGINSNTGWVIVHRFLPDGKADTLFGKGGITAAYIGDGGTAEPFAIALQKDGKIIIAGAFAEGAGGYYGYAVRFLPNGKSDKNFGTGGKTLFPRNTILRDMVIEKSGSIVCGGGVYSGNSDKFYVARLLPNGQADKQFGNKGQVITDLGAGDDFLHELALLPDDKIIAAGVAGADLFNGVNPKLAVVRYNPNGSPDNSFDDDGIALLRLSGYRTQANAVALQTDGKIIAGGWIADNNDSRFLLARYNVDGRLDSSFGTGGTSKTDIGNVNDQVIDISLQRDGKIIAGGLSGGNVLVRYFGGSATERPVPGTNKIIKFSVHALQ